MMTHYQFIRSLIKGVTASVVAVAFFSTASSASDEQEDQENNSVHIVEIINFKFLPATLNVAVGDTVTWINKDIAPHTATAKDKSWNSKQLNQKDSWSMKITTETAENYFCIYHPNMKATLVITAEATSLY